MEDELQKFKDLSDLAQIGWFEIDLHTHECVFSDVIAKILNSSENSIFLQNFIEMVPEEYRTLIEKDYIDYDDSCNEYYRCSFPIIVNNAAIWLSSSTSRILKGAGKYGHDIRKGYLQATNEPISDRDMSLNKIANRLLLGQNTITRILKNFLTEKDSNITINEILKEILNMYDADRTYIFVFEEEYSIQKCISEVTKNGISIEIDNLQHIESKDIPWWTEQILTKKSIILNDIRTIKPYAPTEFKILDTQSIKSLMVIPMIGEKEIKGYLGIDIVDKYYQWSKEDYQWLLSMCNIISICLTLRIAKDSLMKEEKISKKMNRSLKKNEDVLKNVLENIPVSIALYSVEGKPKWFNKKHMEIFGLTSIKDVKNFNLFQDPNVSQELDEQIKKEKSTEFNVNYTFDNRLFKTRRTGTIQLYCKVVKLFDKNGKPSGYLLACIEDTDKIVEMNQIHDFESFFSMISESARIGYAKYNLISNKGYAIKQWYINFGEKETTPLSQIIGMYKHVHPDDRKRVMDFYYDALHGKRKQYSDAIRVHHPGTPANTWMWISKNVVTTKYAPQDGIVELIGINYDITHQKRIEEELRTARDKAEEMDRMKSAFLANMSHEIRTPLNAIIGFSDLLAMTDDKESRHQYISILHENSDLLLQLISDILDLSRIEAGHLEFRKSMVDVNNLCADIVQSMKLKATNNVQLLFVQEMDVCHITTDQKRIRQVLGNLIGNAIKFTESGSITLKYHITGNTIKFEVTDTGIGMKEEQKAVIFDRFVKLNNFVQGTGLGLAICRSIIESLGGRIGVDSEYNKGSHFWFTLPYK